MERRCEDVYCDSLPEYVEKMTKRFFVSGAERNIIKSQLDSSADNVLAVIKRCSSGFPQILLVHPFYKGEVFPTVFWLSCPKLRKDIFQLEDQGLLEKLTDKEKKSSSFSQKMKKAHDEYSLCRRKLMKNEQWKQAASISEDIVKTLKDSGVGGIRTSSGLKCLHTHYAHYAAGGENPVGRITSDHLEIPWLCRSCYSYI